MLSNTENNTKYNHTGLSSSTRQVTGTDLAVRLHSELKANARFEGSAELNVNKASTGDSGNNMQRITRKRRGSKKSCAVATTKVPPHGTEFSTPQETAIISLSAQVFLYNQDAVFSVRHALHLCMLHGWKPHLFWPNCESNFRDLLWPVTWECVLPSTCLLSHHSQCEQSMTSKSVTQKEPKYHAQSHY